MCHLINLCQQVNFLLTLPKITTKMWDQNNTPRMEKCIGKSNFNKLINLIQSFMVNF